MFRWFGGQRGEGALKEEQLRAGMTLEQGLNERSGSGDVVVGHDQADRRATWLMRGLA